MSTIQESTIFSTITLISTTTKRRENRQQHIQVQHVKRKCGSSIIDYNYFFPQTREIQFRWARR